jgi:hypothetical protein
MELSEKALSLSKGLGAVGTASASSSASEDNSYIAVIPEKVVSLEKKEKVFAVKYDNKGHIVVDLIKVNFRYGKIQFNFEILNFDIKNEVEVELKEIAKELSETPIESLFVGRIPYPNSRNCLCYYFSNKEKFITIKSYI